MECSAATEIVYVSDAGPATAYGYAKSKGYTGTEEEYAILLASIGRDLAEIKELHRILNQQMTDLVQTSLSTALFKIDEKRAEALQEIENAKNNTVIDVTSSAEETLNNVQQIAEHLADLHTEVIENTATMRSLKEETDAARCETLEARAAAIDAKVTSEVAAKTAHDDAAQVFQNRDEIEEFKESAAQSAAAASLSAQRSESIEAQITTVASTAEQSIVEATIAANTAIEQKTNESLAILPEDLLTVKSQITNLESSVETLGNTSPYIGENGNWYTYNADTQQYEDTGTSSNGVQIEPGQGLTLVDGKLSIDSNTLALPQEDIHVIGGGAVDAER